MIRRLACGLLTVALVAAAGLALRLAVYAVPYPVEELSPDRGGPIVLTDRNAAVLRVVPSEGGRPGREAWIPLERIPAAVITTILASEDKRFFEHPGVDAIAILTAIGRNIGAGALDYGASTLTMQLVRMVRHPGEPRTVGRKLEEAVLALRLERAMGKREILEQYVNRAYYGNGAYGIEAAARLYFGKPAFAMSPAEATLLAVVPRAPSGYDPVRHLDRALARREHVLLLLTHAGALAAEEVASIRAEPLHPSLHRDPIRAYHFTELVLRALPAEVRAQGGVVRTSLDLGLQEQLERAVRGHVTSLAEWNVNQGGLVVLDNRAGTVLALVGSTGLDTPEGYVDIVTRRRNPGSALKPFVYAAAIEAGDSPASIAFDAFDVPSAYRRTTAPQIERGPARYREALAGSYNLAAIHVLERVGVPTVMSLLRRAGAGPLDGNPEDYGLRLALGAPKVRLLDLASAYGAFTRGGRVREPTPVLDARLADGTAWVPLARAETRIFSEETAWLVADMMADVEARHAVFGRDLPVELPFPVAVKTGTARGFSDTLAIGTTRELTVAAWAGNFDGSATEGLVAMQASAPLVRAGFLAVAARFGEPTLPRQPAGVTTAYVCPVSGMAPGPDCPHAKLEHFAAGHEPRVPCSWHRRSRDARLVTVYPPELASWARRTRLARSSDIVASLLPALGPQDPLRER